MNETIGVKGGHNDRKRSIRIKKKEKKKLEEYEEERKIKELEKEVKKKQKITLIKTLPIAIIGGTVKTIYDTANKNYTSSNDNEIDEFSSDEIGKDNSTDNIDKGKKVRQKIVILPTGEKVTVNIIEKSPKKNILEDILFPDTKEKPTKEVIQDGILIPTYDGKKKKFAGISEEDLVDISLEDLDIDSNDLPYNVQVKIEKLKSHKIVDEYETRLKDIRYELRKLTYEYYMLESESDEIVVSEDATIILDKLSEIIDKLEELKSKIRIEDIDKYDDNYIYVLIEEYLKEFSNGNEISTIKDSPLYIEIASKIDEIDKRKDDLDKKVSDKRDEFANKEKKLEEIKDKYNDIDKINNDLLKFQYEQDRVLKELQEKVANARSVSEKVQIEFAEMNKQSRRLLNLLSLQMFLPGPRIAKKMAANTALYLYFMRNIIRPRTISRRYRVVKVEDYSSDIESSIKSIDNATSMLNKTSAEIDRMIGKISEEFKDYIGVIPEASELLNNLYKIKSEVEEKEYEMEKIKQEQEKVLEENNAKVLTRGEFLM